MYNVRIPVEPCQLSHFPRGVSTITEHLLVAFLDISFFSFFSGRLPHFNRGLERGLFLSIFPPPRNLLLHFSWGVDQCSFRAAVLDVCASIGPYDSPLDWFQPFQLSVYFSRVDSPLGCQLQLSFLVGWFNTCRRNLGLQLRDFSLRLVRCFEIGFALGRPTSCSSVWPVLQNHVCFLNKWYAHFGLLADTLVARGFFHNGSISSVRMWMVPAYADQAKPSRCSRTSSVVQWCLFCLLVE